MTSVTVHAPSSIGTPTLLCVWNAGTRHVTDGDALRRTSNRQGRDPLRIRGPDRDPNVPFFTARSRKKNLLPKINYYVGFRWRRSRRCIVIVITFAVLADTRESLLRRVATLAAGEKRQFFCPHYCRMACWP